MWDKWEAYIALSIVLGLPAIFLIARLVRAMTNDDDQRPPRGPFESDDEWDG